jgi:pyruvate/2-oxoglutarate/acetoin dehydrogenase E1 component
MPVREAINQAIDEEMARDEKVFVIGILSFYLSLMFG